MFYFVALLLVGQTSFTDYTKVDKIYRFGSIVPEVCYDKVVGYDDGTFKKVTVVNGYVPTITPLSSVCGMRYILDYRGQIPVGCTLQPKSQPKVTPKEPTPKEPKLEPVPDPNIHKKIVSDDLQLEKIKREVSEIHLQLTEKLNTLEIKKTSKPEQDLLMKSPNLVAEPTTIITPNYKAEL